LHKRELSCVCGDYWMQSLRFEHILAVDGSRCYSGLHFCLFGRPRNAVVSANWKVVGIQDACRV